MSRRLAVVGGGAAGMFCAANAARLDPALEVIVLEKTSQLLSKVRVSGGGRCNVTHASSSIVEMAKEYPRGGHFVRKAFSGFFVPDTVRWFEERGVALKTEADGRIFPSTDRSETIIQCLLAEADRYGVRIRMNSELRGLERAGEGFRLDLGGPGAPGGRDSPLEVYAVVLACGGLRHPEAFHWLSSLGHTTTTPAPSLFTFNMPGNPIRALMGVSVPDVQVRIPGTGWTARGPVLITHWGCSGPAVLRLSAWGARDLAERGYEFSLIVNWIPRFTQETCREHLRECRSVPRSMHLYNPFGLPARLWEFLMQHADIQANLRWADLPARELNRLVLALCVCELPVRGKTTFKEEFVTCGGVPTTEVDPVSMRSRLVPGLYFVGEMLDVDGITGGYNFQNAWTGGFNAARAIVAGDPPGR